MYCRLGVWLHLLDNIKSFLSACFIRGRATRAGGIAGEADVCVVNCLCASMDFCLQHVQVLVFAYMVLRILV